MAPRFFTKRSLLVTLLPLIPLLFLSGCIGPKKKWVRKKIDRHTTYTKQQDQFPLKTPTITIWIHGTCIPFGVRYFHAPDLGLWPARKLKKTYFMGRHEHLKRVAKKLSKKDPARFNYETFYFFGWSGELSFEERRRESNALYQGILQAIEDCKNKYGKKPYIRIITHSHGGNVALNLAQVKDRYNSILVIDELVFLGCPVQHATVSYAKDPMFKKIYNIFSKWDLTQLGDPQGLYSYSSTGLKKRAKHERRSLFSSRCFPEHPTILQASIRYRGRALFHMEFIFEYIVKLIPKMLDQLDACFEERMKNPQENTYCSLCIE